MAADTCFEQLEQSAEEMNRVAAWLTCIEKYKSIHSTFPGNDWAPAGLYKAAHLYYQLADRPGNPHCRDQAEDLVNRIKRFYPDSVYSERAREMAGKNRITSQTEERRTTIPDEANRTDSPVGEPGAIPPDESETASPPPIPETSGGGPWQTTGDADIKRSIKGLTRDDAAIAAYLQQKLARAEDADSGKYQQTPALVAQGGSEPSGTPPLRAKGDTTVTNLRFWSSPEYTRVVINAESERRYIHKVLKKDPRAKDAFQRLYVDIEQSQLDHSVPNHTPINDNLLKQVRAGQFSPHTVRVVVDIKDFENYRIFSMKDPFRIVIDLCGKGGAVPTEQVVDESTPGTAPPAEKPDVITTDNLQSSDIARQLALGVRKIVIDPGHGGKDPGAPGYVRGVWEKDIVLKLSKTLAQKLRTRLKCEVVLTRTTDKKLTLEARTALANTKRADLFISMHCNAARSKKLSGIETYILNLTTDKQAIAVAARENATSEKNISDLDYILNDLMKHAKIEESRRLAGDVQKAMISGMRKKYRNIRDLGVKQAPFYVLLGARMPAILIETSFLSNKTDCNRLMTASYRNDICNAIADGIEKYINATNPKHI